MSLNPKGGRPSLADRLAAVAGPQIQHTPAVEKDAAVKVQAPRVKTPAPAPEPVATPAIAVTKARIGKTMIAGYFTPQMARAVKMLAVERDTTVQALIGEGLDAVLHKYGKHPMGER